MTTLPVRVINLDRDVGRMQVMAAQLDALGLPFERVPAVLGRALPPAERAALVDEAGNRRLHHDPLLPGEIGCYASHLAVWRAVAAGDAPAVLVLEDDVALTPALPAVVAAVAALPNAAAPAPGWDMVKLIGRDVEHPWQQRPLVRAVRDAGRPAEAIALIRYRRVPSLTSAYLLSRHGAATLLAARPRICRPVDTDLRHWWECGPHGLRVFGAYPYPVRHADAAAQSGIGQREVAGGARRRLHKIGLQLRYSLQAWQANRRQAGDDFARGLWPPASAGAEESPR